MAPAPAGQVNPALEDWRSQPGLTNRQLCRTAAQASQPSRPRQITSAACLGAGPTAYLSLSPDQGKVPTTHFTHLAGLKDTLGIEH